MKRLLAIALLAAALPAAAQKRPPAKTDTKGGTATTTVKVKTYNFGGLDVEGRLKTPQLLYFLNRMKSEFDTTTPDKRSFMPELKRTAEEM